MLKMCDGREYLIEEEIEKEHFAYERFCFLVIEGKFTSWELIDLDDLFVKKSDSFYFRKGSEPSLFSVFVFLCISDLFFPLSRRPYFLLNMSFLRIALSYVFSGSSLSLNYFYIGMYTRMLFNLFKLVLWSKHKVTF